MPGTSKLSALPQESTFSSSDFLVKVKAAGAGDVLVSLADFLNAIAAATGGVFWQEIGRATLGSSADAITISSLPARKYLKILISTIATGGTIGPTLRFNNDSGTNYAYRYSDNFGVAGSSGAGATSLQFDSGAVGAFPWYAVVDVVNIAAQEKLVIAHSNGQNTAGVANFPVNKELMGKWVNTSNQITRVDVVNDGAGDYASGSEVVVLGHN